jgi:phosphatidate cytidylyltransferase
MFRGVRRENAADVGTTLFAVLYAGWLPSLILRLRLVDEGAQWVLALLAATWLYDSGAFFAGKTLGRHKLWVAVSPKKTWEGCAGGLVLAMGALLGIRAVLDGHPAWMPLLPAALTTERLAWIVPLVCVAAQVGDLAESMLKRAANVKDSGALLPGHGGLLDKFDSFLFTGPLMYYLASIL